MSSDNSFPSQHPASDKGEPTCSSTKEYASVMRTSERWTTPSSGFTYILHEQGQCHTTRQQVLRVGPKKVVSLKSLTKCLHQHIWG